MRVEADSQEDSIETQWGNVMKITTQMFVIGLMTLIGGGISA